MRKLLILCLFLLLAGCGGKPKLTMLEGTITFQSAPVARGMIEFEPVDGKGGTAGANIENGKFSVELAPGLKKVRIYAYEVTGTRKAYDTPDSPMVETTKQILPPEWNESSQIQFNVEGKKQEYNYGG